VAARVFAMARQKCRVMPLTCPTKAMQMHPFATQKVKAVFDAFERDQRDIALYLRDLIFAVAADTPEAGSIEETLKWGQPSYLTPDTKSGSTLRIGTTKAGDTGIFAHCATTIISDYAATFPGDDRIDGNRGVLFTSKEEINTDRLRHLIRHGLTYHL